MGSDELQTLTVSDLIYLNSRSPVGSDIIKRFGKHIQVDLNSRSPVGSDGVRMTYDKHMDEFKLTLPCGERLTYPVSAQQLLNI